VQCYIREFVVGISSVEVVPFLLVLCLPQEHAEMGTTSTARNPRQILLVTETTEYSPFRLDILIFKY